MDTIFGALVGVSLAAACGFRIFVPLLVMSVAIRAGQLEVADGWAWLGSWAALVTFCIATVTEVAGYYIPWVDNVLDTIATPAAVVAGTIATAASVTEMDPLFKWSLAIIAGGGIAGSVQAATVTTRGVSTVTTGGVGNPVVATIEGIMSLVLSILAVLLPILAAVIVLGVVIFVVRRLVRRRDQSPA